MPTKFYSLRHCLTDMFPQLFQSVAALGFEIRYADSLVGLPADTDIVVLFAGVHGKGLIYESTRLPKRIKVILYLQAVHGFRKGIRGNEEAMQRVNLILSASDRLFRETWPEHVKRYVFFPNFFASHERYARLVPSKQPIMKCLLTGHTCQSVYPLRHIIRREVGKDERLQRIVDVMLHSRWWKGQGKPHSWEIAPATGDDYAHCLNKYFCSLATLSKFGYAVAKYFEVPAAGSLLLANDSPDVKLAGLQAGRHFVAIDKQNVFDKIKDCLSHPEKYQAMKLEAMEYVRANHSINNRIKLFKEVLGRLT